MYAVKLGDADWTRHVLNFKNFALLVHFVNDIRILLLVFYKTFFLSFKKKKDIILRGNIR